MQLEHLCVEASGRGTPLRMMLEGQDPAVRAGCRLPRPSSLRWFGGGSLEAQDGGRRYPWGVGYPTMQGHCR